MIVLFAYLLIVNAAAWLLMLADKQKARRGAWRISENALMTAALIGGSLGAYMGMKLFRHKTKHPKFSIGLPVILAVHIMLLVGLVMYLLA